METKRIRLTYDGLKKLKESIGVDFGLFNLDSGIIRIGCYGYEDVILQLDKLYGIEEIDNVPYNPAPEIKEAHEELADRIMMIGRDVRVGSVCRIKLDGKVRHVMVLTVKGKTYDCALMNLKVANPDKRPEHGILLHKGSDIIYRNLTYRDVVEVTDEVIHNVKLHYFINGGGIVAGRVINEYTLMKVMKMCLPKLETTRKVQAAAPEVKNPTPVVEKKVVPRDEVTGSESATVTDVQQPEQLVNETVSMPDERLNDENTKSFEVNFESVVIECKTVDELCSNLQIDGKFLRFAIKLCVQNQRVNMKNLFANMQGRQNEIHTQSRGLSQNAIKNTVNQEFATWIEEKQIFMSEQSLTYFLKYIVKNVKN